MKQNLSRRSFLKTFGLGIAAAATSPLQPPATAAEEMRLRYIVASSMFGTMKLADILPEVRKAGATDIDIWPKVHGDQREQIEEMGHDRFAEMLAAHQLKVGTITQYHLGPFKLQPEMPILKKFGGWLLVTGGSGPKGAKGPELKTAVRNFVEKMKPHVEAAGEQGISIGIENHARSLLDNPDSIRWLLEFSTSKHLGLAFAPYHLPQDTALLASLIEDAGDRLFLFYAWEFGKSSTGDRPRDEQVLQMPGRGKLDFTPLMRALKKINYTNYTEPFMHPTPRGAPIWDTPGEITGEINRARKYLENCLKNA